MKLLVDNQLPPALARYLQSERFDCVHVRDIGLASATDQPGWRRNIRTDGAVCLWRGVGDGYTEPSV